MTAPTTFTDRLIMLAQFYRPALRKQLIAAGITLVITYLLCLLGVHLLKTTDNHRALALLMYSGALWVANLTYFCGPLVFAFCRNRSVATTLPASWQQKSVFFICYILIAYPAFLAVVWYAMVGLCSLFTTDAAVNTAFMNYLQMLDENTRTFSLTELTDKFWYSNVASSIIVVCCAAWGVCASRRNRSAMGVVGALGGMFINFLGGMAIGIASIASTEFIEGIADQTPVDPDNFANEIMDNLMAAMPMYSVAMLIISVGLLTMCVLKIKKRQN